MCLSRVSAGLGGRECDKMKSGETDCSLVVVQEVVGSIPISHPNFLSIVLLSYTGGRAAQHSSNGPLAAIFSADYG